MRALLGEARYEVVDLSLRGLKHRRVSSTVDPSVPERILYAVATD